MGWRGGREFFDTVADSLIRTSADDETRRQVCSDLIGSLLAAGWTDDGCALGDRADDPAMVQAFRDHGHFLEYCDTRNPADQRALCRLEAAHLGDHKDTFRGGTWPQDGTAVYGPPNELEAHRATLQALRETAEKWRRYGRDASGATVWSDAADDLLEQIDGPANRVL